MAVGVGPEGVGPEDGGIGGGIGGLGRTRVDVGNRGTAGGIGVAKSVQDIVKHIEAGFWHTHVEGGNSGVARSEVVGIGGEV